MSTESPLLTYLFINEPSFRKARLPALYSDFTTLRTLNPDGYTANINTWITGLSSALRTGVLPPNLLILSLDESLFQSLETKECGRPLALGTVVSEALSRKQFMVLHDYQQAKESIYRSKWAIPSLGEILGWGLKHLGLGFGVGKISGKRAVVLGNVEEAGKGFEVRTKGQRSRVDRVWSLRSFKEEFRFLLSSAQGLSDADFEILLRYLQRDKGLVGWDGETVKLRAKGEADGISTEDASIANLKTLMAYLGSQTKVLESRVDELNIAARQAVERKNRVVALSALRSKKLAETTLGKRHATLAQLEEVFSSIEQAADQVELVRVMEGSARVLAGLNKEVGGVERVDDVVDNLREEMEKVDEVGNVIAEVGQAGVDEGEVDDELEALEKEEKQKIEEVERNEREERERKEAAETKNRLHTLDEVELVAREKAETEKEPEKGLSESVESLKRMSLDPSENVPA